MQRRDLAELAGQRFDVTVLGAGINGCAAAQQLAAHGYKTLIVDKSDFAAGATSKSSRLLHCGLRHLASGDTLWKMLLKPKETATALINARAAMMARESIALTMPELTKPVNFCFPVYGDDPYAPWMVDMAFGMLRMLGPKKLPLDYRRLSAGEAGDIPYGRFLRDPEKLKTIAVFREYLFDWPERIALDSLLDSARLGAEIRNYTGFSSMRPNDDGSWEIELEDMLQQDERASITSGMVLNVSGAWSDELTDGIKPGLSRKVLKLKGAQLVMKLPPELSDWGMMAINRAREPLYCVPLRGLHIVGLNRTPYSRPADSVLAERDEVDWLLGELNHLMPGLNAGRNDIQATMGGLQPITHDPAEPHGSRAIRIHDLGPEGLPNMLTLTGGPIMTHRQVGLDLARYVAGKLSPSGQPVPLSYLSSETSCLLHQSRIQDGSVIMHAEALEQIALNEQPGSLSDVMFRRTSLAWNSGQGREQARQVAEIIARPLGWNDARVEREVRDYHRLLASDFSSHID